MQEPCEIIYLVDDDFRVREAVSDALAAYDMQVISFGSAAEYLAHKRQDSAACLVLDLQLPDISGLDLQRQLNDDTQLPIIFISGHGDIPTTVRAMKAGAIEFLTKPIDNKALIKAIKAALERDRLVRQKNSEVSELQSRWALLTPREREVFALIVDGLLNKQAAGVLGIAEITLQVHRGQVMRKMEADSFADLVRMAGKLGINSQALDTGKSKGNKKASA